jgi:hypothetical protein
MTDTHETSPAAGQVAATIADRPATLADVCHVAALLAVLGQRGRNDAPFGRPTPSEMDQADRLADRLAEFAAGREDRDLHREAATFGCFVLGSARLHLYPTEN